ncbi:SRPBCC family protein [Zeaxanthinibacter enoshimensis]|uniref:Polyketide cyclase/dehydrase/lipid transport protein n=1 Tax=Zeaxanthinibacter enoshimensis TaxID=392009 RepID=A0A4R6TMC0_9FLAO|nr:SRPBCC family protein [Zeaxanthinibacter enoshimensis]TDQ30869.1 polyketide cyclase/dehydrase/lipid transport protein [Zeaxanthinibacter enoshimensis]
MKYTTEIVIDLPREEVIRKLDNAENMKHWQKGLVSYKVLSGEPGMEGSKMEMHYKMGKRELVLIETILTRDFPEAFHATYDTKGVHNLQKNFFEETGENQTRWISATKFEFSGFFMKMMAFLMPGAFKKQSLQYMKDFKAFAEEGRSVQES